MGWLSIFKRDGVSVAGPEAAGDAVQRARTRARQRLIGAVVLVGIGVIGFPLVFETQPRPIPVDIPIEIPRKDIAPPLAMPPARAPVAQTPPAVTAASNETAAAPSSDVITESREDVGREIASPAVSAAPSASASASASAAAAAKPVSIAASSSPGKPAPSALSDGARAQALLEGKTSKPVGEGRFVVQVGAFADAAAAHQTRLKVERLGMKTYTQVASTAAGSRIRVRVGPFGSRDEADKALARVRSAGLTAVVLTL